MSRENKLEVKSKFHLHLRFYTWGEMNIGLTRFGDKHMFKIMLIASKKAITRKWLKTDVPKVEDWTDVIHNIIYTVEKLTNLIASE